MSNSYVDIKELCRSVTIPTVLECVNLELTEKKHGIQWRGDCPMCDSDDTFVFTENVKDTGIAKYYCHHCRKSGDAVTLVHEMSDHGNMKTAANELAEFVGTVQHSNSTRTIRDTVPDEREEGTRPSHSDQLETVLDRLQPEHQSIQELGLSVETCKHFGAGYDPRGAFTRGCLAVPIHDVSGELVAFCGIPLKGKVPTMRLPKNFDPEKYIFNIHRMDAIGDMFMVEDVLGVLLSYENGVENAVCRLTTINENVVPFPQKQSA